MGVLTLLSLMVCLFLASQCWAAPAITGTSGTIAHKQTLTITGSGFGTKSPAPPLIWDDGEDATVDSSTAITGVGTGAKRNDAGTGWDEALPQDLGTVKEKWRTQYRTIPFGTPNGTSVPAPHGRSAKYVVGGSWNNYADAGSNMALTVGQASAALKWFARWYIRLDIPPADACHVGGGNYKDWAYGDQPAYWTGNSRYHATAGDHERVWSGDTFESAMMGNTFGCGSWSPVGRHLAENGYWVVHQVMLNNADPGSAAEWYGNNADVPSQYMNFTCGSGTLESWDVKSFTVGGYWVLSDSTFSPFYSTRNLVDPYIYEWIASSGGKFYLRAKAAVVGDANPDVTDGANETLYINGLLSDNAGGCTLAEGQYYYGDCDSLGYNTYYVRLAGDVDPDTQSGTPCYISVRTSVSQQRGNPHAWRFFDDLYIDSTWSRVMLCNNATYASATICEPQIPSAWAAGEITATVNLGALSGPTAYLFVFDSANAANATGYPISFGSPSPPSFSLGVGPVVTPGVGPAWTVQ